MSFSDDFDEDSEPLLKVLCPLYFLSSSEPCWKCGKTQPVVAIGTHCLFEDDEKVGDATDVGELILLNYLSVMPDEVWQYMKTRNSRFSNEHSAGGGDSYFSNACECGARFGDFYLFSEPGGAFFPTTQKEVEKITYHQMPFEGELSFACGWSEGAGQYILACARKE